MSVPVAPPSRGAAVVRAAAGLVAAVILTVAGDPASAAPAAIRLVVPEKAPIRFRVSETDERVHVSNGSVLARERTTFEVEVRRKGPAAEGGTEMSVRFTRVSGERSEDGTVPGSWLAGALGAGQDADPGIVARAAYLGTELLVTVDANGEVTGVDGLPDLREKAAEAARDSTSRAIVEHELREEIALGRATSVLGAVPYPGANSWTRTYVTHAPWVTGGGEWAFSRSDAAGVATISGRLTMSPSPPTGWDYPRSGEWTATVSLADGFPLRSDRTIRVLTPAVEPGTGAVSQDVFPYWSRHVRVERMGLPSAKPPAPAPGATPPVKPPAKPPAAPPAKPPATPPVKPAAPPPTVRTAAIGSFRASLTHSVWQDSTAFSEKSKRRSETVVTTWEVRISGAPALEDGTQRVVWEIERCHSKGRALDGGESLADSRLPLSRDPEVRAGQISVVGWGELKVRLLLGADGTLAGFEDYEAARKLVVKKLELTPEEDAAHARWMSAERFREHVEWLLHGLPWGADPNATWESKRTVPEPGSGCSIDVAWVHRREKGPAGRPFPIVSTGVQSVRLFGRDASSSLTLKPDKAKGRYEPSATDGLPLRAETSLYWSASTPVGTFPMTLICRSVHFRFKRDSVK